jgi:ferrous iron transport protein B
MNSLMPPTLTSGTETVLVIGKESVGKSQLISSLTGQFAGESNFRGSTVTVERYADRGRVWVDTPGILRQSDTETTRQALKALESNETVLLVVSATHIDDDLADLLPLLGGKQGAIAVTFWDQVQPQEAAFEALESLAADAGVRLLPVDARRLTDQGRHAIETALRTPAAFRGKSTVVRAGWRIEPRPGWLEHRLWGPILAVCLLTLPALVTVFGANRLADLAHPQVQRLLKPWIDAIDASAPEWVRSMLTAQYRDFGYGLLNMGPFLLLWALPTVLLFTVILAAYKASGLVERINVALHPLVRPLGLSGRDVVRVVMGFGCNVPAVISTRACSSCTRGPAVAAISFGAACSYQLPASIAVLSAAARANGGSPTLLVLVFLGYLLVTTVAYLWLTAPSVAKDPLNQLLVPRRPFMQWPRWSALWREARGTLRQFFTQALPIFLVICLAASLLARLAVFDLCARWLGPVMAAFRLPAEAALPVVLASIRKDGIFLFASGDGLALPLTPAQVLTGVYLAGVLLPCLVTALTVARELGVSHAWKLLARQAGFALAFSFILGWVAPWVLP